MPKKKDKNKPDLLLTYYREITKSKHLHFGYWKKGDDLDMKHLRIAQERYLDHFMSFIPKTVKRVLDVGCGVGGNAERLLNDDYIVTSLCPDPLLEPEFIKNTDNKAPFILTKYEDLNLDETFDLVLMAESCQYINTEKGLDKSKKMLTKDGYLLIIDYFKVDGNEGGIYMAGHSQNGYKAAAESRGFKLIKEDDITDHVSPSFDFMSDLYTSYLIPSFKVVVKAMDIYVPFLYKITRALFRKKLKETIDNSNISGETFAKHRRYMVYLFQLQS